MRTRTTPNESPEQPQERGAWAEIKRNWLLIVILLIGAVGAYVFLAPEGQQENTPQFSVAQDWQVPVRESRFRDFTFFTRTGAGAKVSDYFGHPKVVVGYELECEPCMRSLKSLDILAGQMSGQVDFIALAFARRPGALTELINKRYEEYGISNLKPYTLMERDAEGVFSMPVLPHSYVLNADNMIVREHRGEGAWTDQRVVDLLNSLSGS